MKYKLGSLFDGSGGFPLAGSLCDIEPMWAAEVEPYPIAVTRSRFPKMKHLGDISKVNGAEIEPVDIITFGSPCQDLSVAGKRAGLKHAANGDEETTRSGLFMEAVRIIKEMRGATNGKYPRFALWENVPGAFSSNKGEDFRIVCEELIKIVEPSAVMPEVPKKGWPYADSYIGDGWSLAYRVFDAQYWGVPQRRRRIHLVVDFRGECAREVLFEREGVRGYFETGRAPWQGTAGNAENCPGTADWKGECENGCLIKQRSASGGDVSACLYAAYGTKWNGNGGAYSGENFVLEERSTPYTMKIRSGCEGGGKGALVQEDLSATLATNNDQYLFQPVTLEPGIASREGGHIYDGVCGTLRAEAGDNRMAVAYGVTTKGNGDAFVSEERHTAISAGGGQPGQGYPCAMIAFAQNQRDEVRDLKGVAGALAAEPGMKQQTFVALIDSIGGQAERGWEGNVAPTLKATHYKCAPCVAVPCVMEAKGFDRYNQCITGEVSEPLRTPGGGDNYPTVVYSIENHPADSRVDIDETGKVQTLTSRRGTGGGNVPMVMEPVVYNGANVTSPINSENPIPGDPCHTLSTDSRNILVESVLASGKSVAGCLMSSGYEKLGAQEMFSGDYTFIEKSAGFKPSQGSKALGVGFQLERAPTLLAGQEPGVVYCLQGNGIDRADTAGCNGKGWKEDTSYTLNTIDRPAVAYLASGERTTGTLCSGAAQRGFSGSQEIFNGGYHVIEKRDIPVCYIVRRLTPTECARLQGFADRWGDIDEKDCFTDDEFHFWHDVRNTHAAINGKKMQEYTEKQMLTWYNKLHTDSAEYKMWGNGIALPPALYCMQGIVDALEGKSKQFTFDSDRQMTIFDFPEVLP